MDVTVAVLTYGDYPQLAERCLRSIVTTLGETCPLRVGCNAVSSRTAAVVAKIAGHASIWREDANIFKYPLMRKMFYDVPLATEWVMWFDDDSWLSATANAAGPWIDRLAAAAADADLLGSPYVMPWRGNQQAWVRSQPWYGGDAPRPRGATFMTGGWWCIRTDVLRKYDYPWPSLQHNGGDMMLGELCRQQKLRMRSFRDSLFINADDTGKESAAVRRGATTSLLGEHFRS